MGRSDLHPHRDCGLRCGDHTAARRTPAAPSEVIASLDRPRRERPLVPRHVPRTKRILGHPQVTTTRQSDRSTDPRGSRPHRRAAAARGAGRRSRSRGTRGRRRTARGELGVRPPRPRRVQECAQLQPELQPAGAGRPDDPNKTAGHPRWGARGSNPEPTD